MDEHRLILAAQKGDLDAFNRLVLLYQTSVYNQAVHLLGDENAAEDATQEAFLLAYRHIRTFRGNVLRTWLLRIVTNVCYDELRRAKRQPQIPFEIENRNEEDHDSMPWMADENQSPEVFAEQAELRRTIERCLLKLSPSTRAAILFIDFHKLNYAEAAEAAGAPVGTIKSRVARARGQLQNCLQSYWELFGGGERH